MVTFSFREYGENLGTRPLGQRVREQLMPLLEQNDRVVLDDIVAVAILLWLRFCATSREEAKCDS